ncbi:acyl carrier protein [Candidatus Woesearchaeota archaeon]|nr:acyl carrier protein [Candidatus Woesearchaeota archaeon]
MQNLKKIVAKVLDIDEIKVNDSLTMSNAEQWDSFNHLLLISEIEKELGITFFIQEVEKIKSFKDLREIVLSKGR